MSSRFNRATNVWVGAVIAAGLVTAFDLARRSGPPDASDAIALVVFGSLGVFWTLLTFKAGSETRGRAAVALAPAAYLALVPLVQPPVIVVVALVVVGIDWIAHGRHLFAGAFNFGQTLVSLWGAFLACALVRPLGPELAGIVGGTVAGGLVYTAINIALLQVVLRLAVGKGSAESGVVSYAALANEVVVTCFAAMIALCWAVHPLLLAIPVVPQTLLFLTLSRLEQREGSLRRRQSELQSLQELGLQVSAQLDVARLGQVVTRIVAEDMRARGALLGMLTEDEQWFEIIACHDAEGAPPDLPRLRRTGFSDEFLAAGAPDRVAPGDVGRYGALADLGTGGFVAHPLSVLGSPKGLIVVYNAGQRDPFAEEDAGRLSSLVRFIEVALNNARLYEDVKTMQEQLIQHDKMSALGQLVSGVAHELNNPLATILGSAELLGDSPLEERQVSVLRRIRRETDRAARIVRDLLTFSRHHGPELDWACVNEVASEVIEMREYECRAQDVSLTLEADDDMPLIRMDPYQVHQVLLNLVTNAMHALESRTDGAAIVVRTTRDHNRVRIEVVDNGHGIDESRLDKIFDPFFTTKPVGKGTGLGLSICYGIVQAHGGTIRVRSAPGEGTTFTIELPVPAEAPPETAPRQRDAPPAPESAPATRFSGSVLVIDDEPGIRGVLEEALSAWGFEVRSASSGEQGLEALRGETFHLVICDLRMPGLGGRGLYEAACAERLDMPPVVFSTGDAASEEARAFLERTGAPVLLKPFSLTSLRETIAPLVEPADEPVPA